MAAGSLVNLAGTPVSVVARAGAPKPDISSVEALKHALFAAGSIVYADPAKGGVGGVYFASVLNRLGIADQLRTRRSWSPVLRPRRLWPKETPSLEWRRPRRSCLWLGRSWSAHCPENWRV